MPLNTVEVGGRLTHGGRSLVVKQNDSTTVWRVAQFAALAGLVLILVGLVATPDLSLLILWNVLIPLVPASLLVSPTIWRGICPLATLNMSTNGLISRRKVNGNLLTYGGVAGILLLAILVPARHVFFNQNAAVLLITVIAVGLLAMVAGAVFDSKAGFCSTICPVLPVERLYGQRPLVTLDNPRCPTCTHCTSKGCIDLSPEKSIAQTLGRDRLSLAWLTSGFGIFAAAFPGFVIGYYTASDTAVSNVWRVYANVFLWALGSYAVFAILIRLTRMKTQNATVMLGASAAALYYWFAAPGIVQGLSMPEAGSSAIRAAGLGLVGAWMIRARKPD